MAISVDIVRNLFRKKYHQLITNHYYKKPNHRPTRWAVLRGPSYGEKKFIGTLLIDLSRIQKWSADHAKNTWTNQTGEQQAIEFLPEWLEKIDLKLELVTILDKDQYNFLKDYFCAFVNNDWHLIYCPICKVLYKKLDKRSFNEEKIGSKLSWAIEWKCIVGHTLYRDNTSIRLF